MKGVFAYLPRYSSELGSIESSPDVVANGGGR